MKFEFNSLVVSLAIFLIVNVVNCDEVSNNETDNDNIFDENRIKTTQIPAANITNESEDDENENSASDDEDSTSDDNDHITTLQPDTTPKTPTDEPDELPDELPPSAFASIPVTPAANIATVGRRAVMKLIVNRQAKGDRIANFATKRQCKECPNAEWDGKRKYCMCERQNSIFWVFPNQTYGCYSQKIVQPECTLRHNKSNTDLYVVKVEELSYYLEYFDIVDFVLDPPNGCNKLQQAYWWNGTLSRWSPIGYKKIDLPHDGRVFRLNISCSGKTRCTIFKTKYSNTETIRPFVPTIAPTSLTPTTHMKMTTSHGPTVTPTKTTTTTKTTNNQTTPGPPETSPIPVVTLPNTVATPKDKQEPSTMGFTIQITAIILGGLCAITLSVALILFCKNVSQRKMKSTSTSLEPMNRKEHSFKFASITRPFSPDDIEDVYLKPVDSIHGSLHDISHYTTLQRCDSEESAYTPLTRDQPQHQQQQCLKIVMPLQFDQVDDDDYDEPIYTEVEYTGPPPYFETDEAIYTTVQHKSIARKSIKSRPIESRVKLRAQTSSTEDEERPENEFRFKGEDEIESIRILKPPIRERPHRLRRPKPPPVDESLPKTTSLEGSSSPHKRSSFPHFRELPPEPKDGVMSDVINSLDDVIRKNRDESPYRLKELPPEPQGNGDETNRNKWNDRNRNESKMNNAFEEDEDPHYKKRENKNLNVLGIEDARLSILDKNHLNASFEGRRKPIKRHPKKEVEEDPYSKIKPRRDMTEKKDNGVNILVI